MVNLCKKQKLLFPLYCITAEEYSLGRSNIEVARDIFSSGVKILQYREKEKSKKNKFAECLKIRRMAYRAKATLIINDDIDIALAVKADGVHLGQSDMPAVAARRLVGKAMIIGVSTHSSQQAKQAVKDGADYIGVGPIYPTRTKRDVCPAVGLEYLDYVSKNVDLPFVAIGGIKRHNLCQVRAHGALVIAMITEIVSAPDIRRRIREILALIFLPLK
ncbi:MAG: thiamine phosphate synthase [Candidatus Omnitrophota bacterium]|jgi:thiamine-phosphate pyrophosphorylase